MKLNFKKYLKSGEPVNNADAKKLEKATPRNRFMGSGSKFPKAYSGVHESLLSEIAGAALPGAFSASVNQSTAVYAPFNNNEDSNGNDGREYEEEAEQTANKIDLARQLFQAMINKPDVTRKAVIQAFVDQVDVTQSTAVSYYERLAKEAGLTGKGDGDQDIGAGGGMGNEDDMQAQTIDDTADTNLDLGDDVEDEDADPNRIGIIRTVDNAHMIYKRKDEEGKFEELWVYNTNGKLGDELNIRRDILAGTDIPPKKTKSPDGDQMYTLTTLGNAQMLHITGLTN